MSDTVSGLMGRAGMGSWVGTHGGRTRRLHVDKEYSTEHRVDIGHLPAEHHVSPGETCLLSLLCIRRHIKCPREKHACCLYVSPDRYTKLYCTARTLNDQNMLKI